MHRALSDATPILARAFDVDFVKKEVDGVVVGLTDSALAILHELKVLVQTYSPKKVPTEGSILTITGYVMKYIRLLVNHAGSLDTILCHGQASDLLILEGVNLRGCLVAGLIADLESVLEETSSSYASDEELRCLFLSSSWKQVVATLETATTTSPPKRLRNNFLKIFYPTPSPLRSFESAVNRTCKAQMHWKVPSPVLRIELRTVIIEYVVQAYRTYWEGLKESDRCDGKWISALRAKD
uniref:Exocyst subunit Exo70 family protein n=1 Tax=Arundo donax TaxID=35708 RepID=A0A0A9DW85_ARUDO